MTIVHAVPEMQTNPFDAQVRRVRLNLEILHARLRGVGYHFAHPDAALLDPDGEVDDKIAYLEQNIGRLPPALELFYRNVGSVDFTGVHPLWAGCRYPDPIVVAPLEYVLLEAGEYLKLEAPEKGYWASDSGIFRVPIAPDAHHKENISGGMWYGIAVPNAKDDPDLLEEWHNTTFVGYLRICFAWGGFPGLERAATGHTWPLSELRRGLMPV